MRLPADNNEVSKTEDGSNNLVNKSILFSTILIGTSYNSGKPENQPTQGADTEEDKLSSGVDNENRIRNNNNNIVTETIGDPTINVSDSRILVEVQMTSDGECGRVDKLTLPSLQAREAVSFLTLTLRQQN